MSLDHRWSVGADVFCDADISLFYVIFLVCFVVKIGSSASRSVENISSGLGPLTLDVEAFS